MRDGGGGVSYYEEFTGARDRPGYRPRDRPRDRPHEQPWDQLPDRRPDRRRRRAANRPRARRAARPASCRAAPAPCASPRDELSRGLPTPGGSRSVPCGWDTNAFGHSVDVGEGAATASATAHGTHHATHNHAAVRRGDGGGHAATATEEQAAALCGGVEPGVELSIGRGKKHGEAYLLHVGGL